MFSLTLRYVSLTVLPNSFGLCIWALWFFMLIEPESDQTHIVFLGFRTSLGFILLFPWTSSTSLSHSHSDTSMESFGLPNGTQLWIKDPLITLPLILFSNHPGVFVYTFDWIWILSKNWVSRENPSFNCVSKCFNLFFHIQSSNIVFF